jgi:hypothetical protein
LLSRHLALPFGFLARKPRVLFDQITRLRKDEALQNGSLIFGRNH